MSNLDQAFGQTHLGTAGASAAGIPTTQLLTDGAGTFNLFKRDYTSVDLAAASPAPESLMLASASVFTNDKIGPFHGGYQASVKSKWINPKYVTEVYKVEARSAKNQYVSVAPATLDCTQCDTSYVLRVDLKGSPVLRFLNRNAYIDISAKTACCVDGVPGAVNATVVVKSWAEQINDTAIFGNIYSNDKPESKLVEAFVRADGVIYAPDYYTTAMLATLESEFQALGGDYAAVTTDVIANLSGDAATTLALEMRSAYVDTKFGDCTFQPTDNYEVAPIKIYAQQVDESGDPCTNVCFTETVVQEALQVQGTGEGALRDFMLDQSYRQQYDNTVDMRVREITMGDQVIKAIDRKSLYTRYYIKHIVPRPANPSGLSDNDVYLVSIITTGTVASLEAFLGKWLDAAGNYLGTEMVASGITTY